MGKVLITKEKIDVLANSISKKSGVSIPMTLIQMKDAVDSISSSGEPTSVKIIFATDSNGFILLTDTAEILTASGVSF